MNLHTSICSNPLSSSTCLWLTPDPAGEFFNPYARGGDPINFVDPNGECEILCITAIALTVVGAYSGASAGGGSYNPLDWKAKDWDEILTGAVVGGACAAGSAAGFAGGYSGAATWNSLGATTWYSKLAAGYVSGGYGWTAGASTWNFVMGQVEGDDLVGGLLTIPLDLLGNAWGYFSTTASIPTGNTHLGVEGSSIIYSNQIQDWWFPGDSKGSAVGHAIYVRSDSRRDANVIRHERRHVKQFTRHVKLSGQTPSSKKVRTGLGIFTFIQGAERDKDYHERALEQDAWFHTYDEEEVITPFWLY